MLIVAVTGRQGAGKTTAIEWFRNRGLPVIVMGDFVREETRNRGLEIDGKNLGATAQDMRDKHGMTVFADMAIERTKGMDPKPDLLIIDGLRGAFEVEQWKASFGDQFRLCVVTATVETRYKRLSTRGRGDDSEDWDAFMIREQREEGWALTEAEESADYTVENETTTAAFRENVENLIAELKSIA